MIKTKLFSAALVFSLAIISCGPSIKTTGSWVNRAKLPAEPIKSVFIIAFTDNMEARAYLEEDLALAAAKKGLKPYKSIDVIGPVDVKYIAPVKDVFMKKLEALNCETIFTVALVNSESETKYVSGTTITATGYSPYAYNSYTGFNGYDPHRDYGGFGGYYGYAVSTVASTGYYKTDNKYFLEAKMFDLKTEELLFSIQTEAKNPAAIQQSSKDYTNAVLDEIKKLELQKK